MTPIRRLGWTALALFALVGCEPAAAPPPTPTPTPTPTTPATPPASPEATHKAPPEVKEMPVPDKAGEPKAELDKPLTDEQVAEIKKLPADEQPAALAQKFCPVSHDALGGDMGMPIKQTIGDKTFYICCAGCEKAVKNNPDQVLADLAKLKK